jgi:hypothetical protein
MLKSDACKSNPSRRGSSLRKGRKRLPNPAAKFTSFLPGLQIVTAGKSIYKNNAIQREEL